MPQQLLLEGPDLEALMVRARQEYGADCRIVRAEKIRSGGVLGFFQQERYELTIEVDSVAAPAAAPVTGSAQVRAVPPPMSPADAALAIEIADAQAARDAMLAEAVAGPGARGLAALEPRGDETASDHEAVSEDASVFDALVIKLTEEAAKTTPAFAPAVFASVDRFGEATPGARALLEEREDAAPVALANAPVSHEAANVEPEADPVASQSASRIGGVVLHKWGVFTDVASAVATDCTVPALLALGVPLRYLERYQDLDSPVPLLEVVAAFGTPPVKRPEPGDVLVIAGPAAQAVAVATQVAAWMNMPSTAVVLAGDVEPIRGHGRRVRTQAEARGARRKADQAAAFGEPLIIALGVAPGARGAASAAPLLAAFEADTAWAVVDATKRAAVHEPALAQLSSRCRIDGLAAIGTAEAQAPGALLNASLPIVWMDGLPAAAVVWAALLGERIADRD